MECSDIIGCVLSPQQIIEPGDAARIQAAPGTITGSQTADKFSSGPSISSEPNRSDPDKSSPSPNATNSDSSSQPNSSHSDPSSPSNGTNSDPSSDSDNPAEGKQEATSEDNASASPASQEEHNTFFKKIKDLYEPAKKIKIPLKDEPIIKSLNNFLMNGSLINAREDYKKHLDLLYNLFDIEDFIKKKEIQPQQNEFKYHGNMHIVALALYLLSKLPTVGFEKINGALLTPVETGDEQAKAAEPAAQDAKDKSSKDDQEITEKPEKIGGTLPDEPQGTGEQTEDAKSTTPPPKVDESSPRDGPTGSPTDDSFNIFNIPNDSTYASSFEAFMKDEKFMKDPCELMYFFLLRNVEFVITGNKFAIDIQPPSLINHIETLFSNNDFVKMLLPKETNKPSIDDLMSILSKVSEYIENHITSTLSKMKTALETRIKSYLNRRTFFDRSTLNLRKGLDKAVYNTTTIITGGGHDDEKKANSFPQKFWETHIVQLATLAPAAYVFIETCCPYVKQYCIHNIDKAQLLKVMILRLLNKDVGLFQGITSKLKNLVTKDKDKALMTHLMQTYNNTEAQKLRYPVLRDFKELFQNTSDSDACAYEYLRILDIIRTSSEPSDMGFYYVGVKNTIEKEKQVYFPHTKVLVGSMAGNILTYSYPFRLDIPEFIYKNLEKKIKVLIDENETFMVAAASQKEIIEKVISIKGTWNYIDPDKSDEPAKEESKEQDGPKKEVPEGQDKPVKEGSEEQDGPKKEGPEGQDEPAKEGSKEQDGPKKEGPEGQDEPVKVGGATLNSDVINFIKTEVLEKLTNKPSAEKTHTYYYAHLKNVLLKIVKVADKDYTLEEKDLIERTMRDVPQFMTKGIPTPISKTRSSVMARLNEAHNMLRAFKGIDGRGIDVNDTLDLYEVYFTNIERVLFTQKKYSETNSPGIVKPEAAGTELPQEGVQPTGDKPEAKGGSQKKYKFQGRFYNINEHRSIKYIITKEYGIVPIHT
jgi:hypothetical protein